MKKDLPITDKEIKLVNQPGKNSLKCKSPKVLYNTGASTMTTHVMKMVSSNTTPLRSFPLQVSF